MAEDKTPMERALDLWVYGPVGLALVVRDEFPKLAERGRQQLTGQIMLARMVGQFAVTQGQKELEKRLEHLLQQTGGAAGRTSASAPPAPAAPPPTSANGSGPSTNGHQTGAAAGAVRSAGSTRSARSSRSGGAASTGVGRAVPVAGGPSSEDLAIPGYDTLSASQVVQRLAGLTEAELEAVRRYEAGTRGRRTILSKVAQLQSGA